ncbi:MAG: hypothetical protein AB7O44_26495 [Hyphomicrobiaceae bacterium]
MVTIEQMTVTVTVEGSGEPGDAAFLRLFNRNIDLWWREMQARAAQEARLAAERSLGVSRPDAGGRR